MTKIILLPKKVSSIGNHRIAETTQIFSDLQFFFLERFPVSILQKIAAPFQEGIESKLLVSFKIPVFSFSLLFRCNKEFS
ncbi:hypothetical protein DLM78_16355 [Leptospira stimsonii]|uniref:Uncharacterized protein n=1 Tax=Leptospira stimsonii TaxID=2202203 RepID=A0A8B3CPX3_9LEPT|nr:hypothetical protein DLM78_16355 [Leptospira stimsonii]